MIWPALLWLLWVLYVFTMALYRAHLSGRLSRSAYVLGFPFIALAIALDLFINWTVATAWFREWPVPVFTLKPFAIVRKRPDLVTSRLSRYINGPDGWRKNHAKWLCDNLLDDFDPSENHCGERETPSA